MSGAALRIENLAVSFGGVRAVDGVSIEVDRGEKRVLLGPNGAGKTTLFNLIGGQLQPTQGRIRLFDEDITRLTPFRRAQAGVARTFQITNLFPSLTVAENIYLAVQGLSAGRYAMLRAAGSFEVLTRRVEKLLSQWSFTGARDATVRDLPYGDQRRLEIAMAFAQKPRLLLLDEPTAGLSEAETHAVTSLIKGLERDVTVVVIEHDMDVAFEVGERFTILYQGRIMAEGSPEEIRANEQIQSVYFGVAE